MRSEKIVLIEDHAFYRNRIGTSLTSQGYIVAHHAQLDRLDEVIQLETPYLLIVGTLLTGSDPYLPMKYCQACYPWLPVLVLLERDQPIEPMERIAALQQGCTDLLLKRVDRLELLLQRVHDLLRPGSRVDRHALLTAYAQELPPAI